MKQSCTHKVIMLDDVPDHIKILEMCNEVIRIDNMYRARCVLKQLR